MRLNHDYYIIELYVNLPDEVFEWCKERFGEADGYRWFLRNRKLYFADPKDHMMFLLRWS